MSQGGVVVDKVGWWSAPAAAMPASTPLLLGFSLLLQCGDVERNPGSNPRPSKTNPRPSKTERKALRTALQAFLGPEASTAAFEDGDIDILWRAKCRDSTILKAVSREILQQARLSCALINTIIKAQPAPADRDFNCGTVRFEWLVTRFSSQIAAVAAADLPGAARSSAAPYDISLHLREQSPYVGREVSVRSVVHLLARIFMLWRARKPGVDGKEFHRNFAYILMTACPGAGKSTCLIMLRRQVREWRDSNPVGLERFVSASVGHKDVRVARAFVEALTASLVVMPVIRLGAMACQPELERGVDPEGVAALRLLHALLSPSKPYSEWLYGWPDGMRHRICLNDVGLLLEHSVPSLQQLILCGIDEANAANGDLMQRVISAIIMHNSRACSTKVLALIIATSQCTALSLQLTASGKAQGGMLPLPALPMKERWNVINGLRQKLAGHDELQDLPPEAVNILRILLEHVGGNPGMIMVLLEVLCDKRATELESRLARLSRDDIHRIINRVRSESTAAWQQLLAVSSFKHELLGMLLALSLLDVKMCRDDRLTELPCWQHLGSEPELFSELGLTTVSDLESQGVLGLEDVADSRTRSHGDAAEEDLDELPANLPGLSLQPRGTDTEPGSSCTPAGRHQMMSLRQGLRLQRGAQQGSPGSTGAQLNTSPIELHDEQITTQAITQQLKKRHHEAELSSVQSSGDGMAQQQPTAPDAGQQRTSQRHRSAAAGSSRLNPLCSDRRHASQEAVRETGGDGSARQQRTADADAGASRTPPRHLVSPSQQDDAAPAASPAATPAAIRREVEVAVDSLSTICTYVVGAEEQRLVPSPSKADALIEGCMVQQTHQPGQSPVRATLSLLTIGELLSTLRLNGEYLNERLTNFHSGTVRRGGLDKERVDLHSVALKFDLLRGVLHLDRWPLRDLLPGINLPGSLDGMDVLVPTGRFDVEGRVSARGKDERLRLQAAAHARMIGSPGANATAILGYAGPGNKGSDATVFLTLVPHLTPTPAASVPAAVSPTPPQPTSAPTSTSSTTLASESSAPSASALLPAVPPARTGTVTVGEAASYSIALELQSKQRTQRQGRPLYITAQQMLRDMQQEVSDTVDLPDLNPRWRIWQDSPLPTGGPPQSSRADAPGVSNDTSVPALPPPFLYCYITDHVLSNHQQDWLQWLREEQHPWMQFLVVVVPRHLAASWYSEMGQVKRQALQYIAEYTHTVGLAVKNHVQEAPARGRRAKEPSKR